MEWLFIVSLITGLIGWTFLLLKDRAFKAWLPTMCVIGAVVGLAELLAMWYTGCTISQLYWRWSVNNIWQSWVAMGIYLIGQISLVIHLQWKVMFDKDYKKG